MQKKSRGFIWNSEKMNYEYVMEADQYGKDVSQPSHISDLELPCGDSVPEVITYLKANKEVLMEIVGTYTPIEQLPRYVIPGVYTTKSVYMNHNFDLLTRRFSEEKNISQRDIFEIALIDFFKKYGYREKLQAFINTATPVIQMVAAFAVCTMF
jgi:hypothetical protein